MLAFSLNVLLDFYVVARVLHGLIDYSRYEVVFASCGEGGGDTSTQSRPDRRIGYYVDSKALQGVLASGNCAASWVGSW